VNFPVQMHRVPRAKMPEPELTRRAMYDLVWSRPLTSVAEDFGISDVALKKICTKHRVPTPPRGYWAKRDAGKPTKQIPFYNTTDPQQEHIVIHGSRDNFSPEVREILNQERERRRAKPVTTLPDEVEPTQPIQDVHPTIALTARALRKAKPGADGVVRADGHGHCGIEVSLASMERAIGILDGIARGLDARGLKIGPVGNRMQVATPPDELTFSLVERIEKRNHAPTIEELSREQQLRKKRELNARLGIWSFDRERAYPEFDFIRTGELSVRITDDYVRGLRRNWGDGKHRKIETAIDDIVGGIIAYLAGVKANREERERRQRKWDREREQARLARAREEREKQRREFLRHFVSISTEADELKSLLERLRDRPPVQPAGELARMLEWAEARLVQLEGELAPDGIVSVLRERELFPEIDNLLSPEREEE
jgi:hypothetical protein